MIDKADDGECMLARVEHAAEVYQRRVSIDRMPDCRRSGPFLRMYVCVYGSWERRECIWLIGFEKAAGGAWI